MPVSVLVWSSLTIIAWGWFGYAAKRSTMFFGRFPNGERYTQLYQPIGYVLSAGVWGLMVGGFRPNFHLIGVIYAVSAGLLLGIGLHFFTKALATQDVSIVAPLTSMYPLLTLLLSQFIATDSLTSLQQAGLAFAIPSIWLLNGQIRNLHKLNFDNGWLRYSLLTIICWGIFALFPKLALAHLTHGDVAVYQALGYFIGGSLLSCATLKGRIEYDKRGVAYALACGVGAGSGGIFYLYAVELGNIAIVAPLTSLYPIVTVLLARLLLNEQIAKRRKVGIVFACASIMLMSF